MKTEKYPNAPKRWMQKNKLGVSFAQNGTMHVIAGFVPPQWWSPFPSSIPIIVTARIIRLDALHD